jgi:hypothetical protein
VLLKHRMQCAGDGSRWYMKSFNRLVSFAVNWNAASLLFKIGVRPADCNVSHETQLITCKRGSAKYSVKDDHAFLWKNAIFRHLPSRNPSIKMKICTIDYVGGVTRCAKNGCNRFAGGGPIDR